jgi:hypothetical protein
LRLIWVVLDARWRPYKGETHAHMAGKLSSGRQFLIAQ